MKISDFLSPADVMVEVRVARKRQLLQELAQKAAVALDLPADHLAAELLKREALGSTGTGGGISIPHARIQELKRPYGILVRLRKPIDFDAIDGQPVDIVFMMLLPAVVAGEQLNALAAVARKIRDAKTVRNLRHATDGASMYQAMIQ